MSLIVTRGFVNKSKPLMGRKRRGGSGVYGVHVKDGIQESYGDGDCHKSGTPNMMSQKDVG